MAIDLTKLTTVKHLQSLATLVKQYDDALGARIDEHVSAIEAAGYQNASQVSTAVQNAITGLNIGQYALDSDLETLESKVEGLVTAGGEPNVIEVIKVDGVALTVTDKAVNIEMPEGYDDTELAGRVSTVEGKVTTLIGEDADKSVRTIAAEEVAEIVAGADESYNTLKEIADWISTHGSDAATMNSNIATIQKQLSGIGETEGAVKAYVDGAIEALSIGDYAKASELTALAARVTTLEGVSHSHDNKDVLDGITSTKVSAWDAAEGNAKAYAKEYADGLNTAMDTRVQVVEGKAHEHSNKALLDTYTQTEANLADAVSKKHSHSNKAVLDGITAAQVTAWDAAEQNAKDYADGLAGNYDAKGSAAQALTDAKAYADGLAGNYDTKGAAAQALTDAKSYADGLNSAMDTRVKALEGIDHSVYLTADAFAADDDVNTMLNEVFAAE